jgi:hypothetical protein
VAAAVPQATLTKVADSSHVMQVDRPDAIVWAIESVESLRTCVQLAPPVGGLLGEDAILLHHR